MKVRHHSIHLKILLVYIVALLFTSSTLFVFFSIHFRMVYKEQANSHMADMADMSTVNMTRMIEQIEQLSVSILVNQIVQDNLKEINKKNSNYNVENISQNEAAISRQVRGSVFNIDGIISLRVYPIEGGEIFIGTTNREFLEYSMTAEEIYAAGGGAVWGMTGEDNYICMGRAILSTEDIQPLGYMVIICKNEYLSDKLSNVSSAYSRNIYLIDQQGQVVASNVSDMVGGFFPYTIENLNNSKVQTIKDPAWGEDSYYYVGESITNGWKLVTTISTNQVRNSIMMSILQMAVVLLSAVAVAFVITKVAIRKLLAPAGVLLDSISAFGEGKLDSRVELSAMDEIGQLSQAYNHMADNIQNLMEKVYSLEIANNEAEIEFLKMQINPHFLYNSLDTISWLGYSCGNEKISQISVALAKLLRASINRTDMVTVEEEMQIVQNYLLIQGYRFADKIETICTIDPEACDCYMPSFLLQPLIENSITHGLESQIGKGSLHVSILKKENGLYFSVTDDGRGMTAEMLESIMMQCKGMEKGGSIGLKNVYRRLQLLYGESCDFAIKSKPEKGTSISFRIPVINHLEIHNQKDIVLNKNEIE